MQARQYTLWTIIILLGMNLIACERKTTHRDPTDLLDQRDGQHYSTEKYGTQWWMAENLAYNFPGSKINPNNPFSEYGRLYNHAQALVACPEGWHLPSDREWQILERHLGVDAQALGFLGYRGGIIGRALKSSSGWALNNGSNELLFNAYPSGHYKNQQQSFENLGQRAEFWSASENTSTKAWVRHLTKDFDSIYRGDALKEDYHSCRCIKNE